MYIHEVNLDDVAAAMQERFVPFVTRIKRIEFSRVYEDESQYSYDIVDFIELH